MMSATDHIMNSLMPFTLQTAEAEGLRASKFYQEFVIVLFFSLKLFRLIYGHVLLNTAVPHAPTPIHPRIPQVFLPCSRFLFIIVHRVHKENNV